MLSNSQNKETNLQMMAKQQSKVNMVFAKQAQTISIIVRKTFPLNSKESTSISTYCANLIKSGPLVHVLEYFKFAKKFEVPHS